MKPILLALAILLDLFALADGNQMKDHSTV
jgi:hypothetical protein